MKTIQEIKELIAEIPYIDISTVTPEGKPWSSPCWAAYDDDYNFYWTSSPEAQHSINIKSEPSIFFVIYNSSLTKDGWGLYAQAKAYELETVEDIERALKIFYKRKGRTPLPADNFLGQSSKRMYKAIIEKAWINDYDKTRTPADFKIEIELI